MRHRHSSFAFLVAAALIVGACGGGTDAATTTLAATTTTTTTTAASITSVAPTTIDTTAASITSLAPTTIDTTAARVAGATALAGSYSGAWENTTYGSTGSITAVLEVDAPTGTLTIELDLGGNVFGASDPDPVTVTIDLSREAPYTGSNELFGEFSIGNHGHEDHFTLEATAVPGLGGLSLLVDLELEGDGVSGTYSIPQLPAQGTFEATRS